VTALSIALLVAGALAAGLAALAAALYFLPRPEQDPGEVRR
jgi:hypothetical protein